MPQLAQQIHRLCIVRGVNYHIPDHNPVGWDTHAENFSRLRDNLPVVDRASAPC